MTAESTDLKMTIISGLSGAGKSLAIATFEDMGYFCIDNLPPQMLTQVAKLFSLNGSKVDRAALVLDARAGDSLSYLDEALGELDRLNVLCRVVFLEASDEALVARFHSTRRTHPLTGSANLVEGIQREREILAELRERADVVIDTTSLNVHDLRRHIQETVLAGELQDQILMTFMSFGYKYGVPCEVDMVFDARFLPNPHWVPELRPLTGLEDPVRDYVLSMGQTQGFVERVVDLLTYLAPSYLAEQKRQLLVGIGCTGGRHRSVALAQTLAGALEQVPVVVTAVRHRDVGRKG